MAYGTRQIAPRSPAPVPVHDDGYVYSRRLFTLHCKAITYGYVTLHCKVTSQKKFRPGMARDHVSSWIRVRPWVPWRRLEAPARGWKGTRDNGWRPML